MKKIILSIILALSMLLSVNVFAEEKPVTVTVNDKVLEFDVPPQLVNGRTMLPMRAIFEALGAKVTWFEADQLVFATCGDAMLTLQIGNNQMSVQRITSDKNEAVPLDAAPFLHEGRTMVPARAIAESVGAKVEWIEDTWTVVITK